jgi:hypothetical protein
VRGQGKPGALLLKQTGDKQARAAQALLPLLSLEEMEAGSSSFVFGQLPLLPSAARRRFFPQHAVILLLDGGITFT